MERLMQQMNFLIEADKLKTIVRRNYLSDGSRRENDAEHSWYFSLAALILAEYANRPIDIDKVTRMAIVHDIVEIYAGDTFIYDEQARASQKEREQLAAEKIFGLLPEDQKKYFADLWNEFEENASSDAKFARAIDRIVAVLLNVQSDGKAWREHQITYERVYEICSTIADGSSELWNYTEELLKQNRGKGLFYNK
jgi:putative hydrolases of HD superfamily